VVLCIPIAVSAERRLHPKMLVSSGPRPKAAPPLEVVRRKHRQEWIALISALVLYPCVTIVLITAAFSYHDKASVSQFTQRHGVPRSSTVLSVQNMSVKGGYISQIHVRLVASVNGQVATTVYVTHKSVVSEGQTLSVLVDPNRPDYAELPGQPYTNAGAWIVALIFAVVCAAFTGFCVIGLITMIRRQRAYREMLTSMEAP
jgi:hypothetical protein